jgi:hypothetical protein
LASDSLVIRYDPAVLTFQGIRAGSLLAASSAGFGTYATNVSPGLIKALVTSAHGTGPLAPGALGSLGLLTFTVSRAVPSGRSVLNLEATDGVTTTAVVDNNFNTLRLSPAPTNAANDAADGVVTIVSSLVKPRTDTVFAFAAWALSDNTPAGKTHVPDLATEAVTLSDRSPNEARSASAMETLAFPKPQEASIARYRAILDSEEYIEGGAVDELTDLWPAARISRADVV